MRPGPARWLEAGAIAASLLPTGCAWLFGQAELAQPRSPLAVARPTQTASVASLALEVTFLGPGRRHATARNALGRIARVVNPYGEDTWLFAVSARNTGREPLVLLPQAARLNRDAGDAVAARGLEAYRRRWPSWAVEGEEQAHDQAAAYHLILDSLLLERRLAPGQSCAGQLAFPGGRGAGTLALQFAWLEAGTQRTATLRWEPI